jgi:hypothetical protein
MKYMSFIIEKLKIDAEMYGGPKVIPIVDQRHIRLCQAPAGEQGS